ncbi:hypothetical protein BAT_2368 [Bacillus pumilus ATCC 7061]|nr:hypothetical protein BAT_2368 [Bacillus pumilus ATCC 7061]
MSKLKEINIQTKNEKLYSQMSNKFSFIAHQERCGIFLLMGVL